MESTTFYSIEFDATRKVLQLTFHRVPRTDEELTQFKHEYQLIVRANQELSVLFDGHRCFANFLECTKLSQKLLPFLLDLKPITERHFRRMAFCTHSVVVARLLTTLIHTTGGTKVPFCCSTKRPDCDRFISPE